MRGHRTHRQVARAWQPDVALLDGLTIAAVALDAGGAVVYANSAALDLFGSPFDHLVGSDAPDPALRRARARRGRPGPQAPPAYRHVDRRAGHARRGNQRSAMPTAWTRLGGEGEEGGALVLVEGVVGHTADPYAAGQPLGTAAAPARRRSTSELLTAEDMDAVCAIVTDHMMSAAGATAASLSLVEGDSLGLIALRGGLEGAIERWAPAPSRRTSRAPECVRPGAPSSCAEEELAALPGPPARGRHRVGPLPTAGRDGRARARHGHPLVPGRRAGRPRPSTCSCGCWRTRAR